MSALSRLLDPFLSLLYPPRCLGCSALGTGCLCAACIQQISSVPESACDRCGHPLEKDKPTCRRCAGRPPAFDHARALGTYGGVLKAAIHQFKYRDRPQLAEPLGVLLAEYASGHSSALNDLAFDAIIAMPMHPTRQRLRGYNQSERLARVLGRELSLPVEPRTLARIRRTRPQVGLSGEARRRNLLGAFAVPCPDLALGKTLLLVDDVHTTGSSLHECAATLKSAGAKTVYALTLAVG